MSEQLTKKYREMEYSFLLWSAGSMRSAFKAYIEFVSALSKDIRTSLFEGVGRGFEAGVEMAATILKNASEGEYGNLTEREVLAYLKLYETSRTLAALNVLCQLTDGLGDLMNAKIDTALEHLRWQVILLRIVALPTAR